MKVYLAGDHGGFYLKQKIKEYLTGDSLSLPDGRKFEVEDLGPFELNPNDDYPDYVLPLAERVTEQDPGSLSVGSGIQKVLLFGIVFCRSGGGEVIAANKVRGIRAVLSWRADHAKMTRRDNDANVLCLPSDYLDEETAKEIVKTFLVTPFSGEERHLRRLKKIEEYEGRN